MELFFGNGILTVDILIAINNQKLLYKISALFSVEYKFKNA